MEEELLAGVPCSSRAVESVIRVSTVINFSSNSLESAPYHICRYSDFVDALRQVDYMGFAPDLITLVNLVLNQSLFSF